jgi:excisionase family DNA binding protein
MRDLMTVKEVAEELKVKEATVTEWLRTGRLRGVKAGRQWRVPADAVEEFLKRPTTEELQGGPGTE